MEAREYLDLLKDENAIIRVYHSTEKGAGRGEALIIDEEHNIAVMLTDCGFIEDTLLKAGAIVRVSRHPEAEPTVIGTPAYIRPIQINGQNVY